MLHGQLSYKGSSLCHTQRVDQTVTLTGAEQRSPKSVLFSGRVVQTSMVSKSSRGYIFENLRKTSKINSNNTFNPIHQIF